MNVFLQFNGLYDPTTFSADIQREDEPISYVLTEKGWLWFSKGKFCAPISLIMPLLHEVEEDWRKSQLKEKLCG